MPMPVLVIALCFPRAVLLEEFGLDNAETLHVKFRKVSVQESFSELTEALRFCHPSDLRKFNFV